MSNANTVKAQIQSLIDLANTTTSRQDTNLTDGVNALVSGYGQGGSVIPDDGILYNWDFTESLTDKKLSRVATISSFAKDDTGTGTIPTLDNRGVTLTDTSQYLYLGEINLVGRTIEIDVASFDFAGSTDSHIRFLTCNTINEISQDNKGNGLLVWRKNNTVGWSSYLKNLFTSLTSASAWSTNVYGNLSNTDSINYFDGKTVKIVIADNGIPTLYVDNVLIGSSDKYVTKDLKYIYIGGSPTSSYDASVGNQCYNVTISAIRVYKKETEKPTDTLVGLKNGYDVMFYDENDDGLAFYSIRLGDSIEPPIYTVRSWKDSNGNVIVFPYKPTSDIILYADNDTWANLIYDLFNIDSGTYPYLYIRYSKSGYGWQIYFAQTWNSSTKMLNTLLCNENDITNSISDFSNLELLFNKLSSKTITLRSANSVSMNDSTDSVWYTNYDVTPSKATLYRLDE